MSFSFFLFFEVKDGDVAPTGSCFGLIQVTDDWFAKLFYAMRICSIAACCCFLSSVFALREASDEGGKKNLRGENETAEDLKRNRTLTRTMTMGGNDASELNSTQIQEMSEQVGHNHARRDQTIPSWFECFEQDPNGPLHMGLGFFMVLVAVIMELTRVRSKVQGKAAELSDAKAEQGAQQDLALPDVDADGSDDEEEDEETLAVNALQNVEEAQKKMKYGLSMRFAGDDFERKWFEDSYPKSKRRGAVILAMVAAGMILDRAYSIHELSTCSGDGWWLRKLVEAASIAVLSKVFFFLAILMPNADATQGSWADRTYWAILFFFAAFFLAVNVHPLGMSCDDVAGMSTWCSDPSIATAATKKDCTLQGHTACQMLQLWMLVMPYVLPQFDCWSYTFVWLVFIYTGCSWLYTVVFDERVHVDDLPLHFILLAVTACLGTMKKYFLEKGLRRQFRIDYEEKKVLEDLYNVFDGMVPTYVIPRMLREETIADPIERVTILFVLIVIDDSAHSMDPKKTLADLNQIFGRMDEICAKYQVTKIETVAEEYVACVGVLPKDHGEMGDKAHYDKLLMRMFLAASEILDMENQDFRMGGQKVQLKMGTHTGKIIAGVIGKKLPRFRLFGDTINTSARMMQKSKPGQLMFGEETNQVLPSCIPSQKGEKVMMKGKGEVEVYYFDRAAFQAAEAKRLLEDQSGLQRLFKLLVYALVFWSNLCAAAGEGAEVILGLNTSSRGSELLQRIFALKNSEMNQATVVGDVIRKHRTQDCFVDMTKEKKERRKEKEKERRKEKRKAKEKVSSPGEEESWSWEETWQNEAWGVQDWGEAWAEQDAEYWLLDSGASVVADFFFLSFTGEERVSVRRDNLRVLILVERMSSMVGAVLTTESVIRARHEIIMWLREFGLVSGSTSVLLSTDSESAVSDLVGTAASEFTFSVRKAGPQQHEAVGAAERAVRKVKEALQTLRSDLNAEGSQAIRVRASIRIERRLEALGDRVQPSSSDEPREVLELPVYEDGLASRLVLDEVCEDAEAPRREDAEVGESQPSLLKRPMPAARISTGEHMDLDLPGEPSAASGVKRRSDVEVVDLERLEGEMQQTSHLKPRRLDELLWGSDLAVPVCLDERLTGPNIHGTGISSIVYESGPQSRSEAELVKLGGKSVLLWKPYGGVDDSTMEELDGSLVFEGMKEELVNLERCRTGRVINVLILMYVDDLLIVSESEAAEMAVREAIGSKLTLKITGTIKPSYAGGGATSFIGRFIRRWPGSSVFEVGIDKEYLQPCFTAYGVQKGSSAVPDISAILDRTGETELSQEAYGLFRRALGKVLWFSQTRQDLKLIIGLISTQQSKPAQATEAALRALLRFLYDDRNVALQLPSEQLNEAFLGCPVEELERKVHVFPHASHAPYRFLARRGITGGALTYAGALVRGVAKTQGVVCLSSCEAELHALQHMEQEAVCFAFLLERVLTSLGNLRGGEHVDISLDSSKFEQDGETPGEQVQIDVISDSEAALAVIHAEDIPKRKDGLQMAGWDQVCITPESQATWRLLEFITWQWNVLRSGLTEFGCMFMCPVLVLQEVFGFEETFLLEMETGSTEVEVVEFPDNDYPDYESDQSGLQRLFKLLVKQGNQDTEESQAKKSEDERQQEVNEVIQQVFDSSEPTGWLLSHKEGFTDDAQELAKPNSKMFSEVPEAKVAVILELLKAFVRKFRSRLHRQALLMAAVTFCDLFLMEWMKAYQVQDKGSGFLPNTKNGGRFQVLLGCRDLATDWMMENVALVQWGVVATSTIVSALMFVSYDALVFPQITKSYENMQFLEYVNQQLSLVFVLAFFI
ncbi:gcy-14, partial [Symbiodinium microadriaticum]